MQSSLSLNNISEIHVNGRPIVPICITGGNWSGIGWGDTTPPCGQYNFIEDGVLKARLYSGGLNYTIKTSETYLAKDSNAKLFWDTGSQFGAFACLVGATAEEYETVFVALVDLVDKINECWENI